MNKSKLINMLGLAQKAGKVISGDFVVEKHLKARKPLHLLFIARDTASNNLKKYSEYIAQYKLNFNDDLDKEELGGAIGKKSRMVVGIVDENFARALQKISDE